MNPEEILSLIPWIAVLICVLLATNILTLVQWLIWRQHHITYCDQQDIINAVSRDYYRTDAKNDTLERVFRKLGENEDE